MERYLTPSEVAEIFGMSRSGIIKWIREGKIKAIEINGRWRIPYSEVERLISGKEKVKQVAIYARVSSNTQKDDLERQLNTLKEWVKKTFGEVSVTEVKDIGSGLKEDRRGLKKLIELAKRRQIDTVVVAYKDRLTRFGFEYLVELFKAYGVNIIVAFQDEPKDYIQELVEDFAEIVKSFASKIYGHKYEKVIKCVEDTEKDN
ncbi:IS607 family transposase [Sulfurisphaera ohwakuensis]|uniref:Excisionase family DNA binding protein n=1 Tax=Sulfurisphaera ohwakuensis TaxID=69656 RepID=A0A650CII2_SULOH|nr:IS607 family transposase [Sulfurisphaera ohwakuensis]MBB5253844.1 excisionase family DNA binding protein [Sulfurisphaera ohwakuensis]QGR17485.1 IS607 family transposase [Sulfurisphaera ohwakuensis]